MCVGKRIVGTGFRCGILEFYVTYPHVFVGSRTHTLHRQRVEHIAVGVVPFQRAAACRSVDGSCERLRLEAYHIWHFLNRCVVAHSVVHACIVFAQVCQLAVLVDVCFAFAVPISIAFDAAVVVEDV